MAVRSVMVFLPSLFHMVQVENLYVINLSYFSSNAIFTVNIQACAFLAYENHIAESKSEVKAG
jgi:hypothetical protein